MSLTAIQQLVDNLVRDDAGKITQPQRDEALALAVARFSKDRPQVTVEDLTSVAGGKTLSLPTGWDADFSALKSIEYPIGDVPPTLLPADEWMLYQTPTGKVISLVNGLSVGAVVRVSYTVQHQLTASLDTIPTGEREAFANLAASMLCLELAAAYSNRSDSTIQADSVDYASQAREYRDQAKAYEKAYLNKLGVDEKRSTPAGAVVELKRTNSLGGDRLWPRSAR